MKMYRHGDILIQQIESIPTSAKEQIHSIIAEGEATGHAHRLHSGIILEDDNGNMFVRVPEGKTGALTHEEHDRIELPAGDYVVIRQREYAPYEQAVRQVAD